MDGIKVCDGGLIKWMEYARPCYKYIDWIQLVKYTKSIQRYGVAKNYIQLKDNDHNKGQSMYIEGKPKATRNIAWFINNAWPATKNKQPNYIFEGHEGNRVFVCAIKSIVGREEVLINYNLNRIDTNTVTILDVVHPTI